MIVEAGELVHATAVLVGDRGVLIIGTLRVGQIIRLPAH